MTRALRPLLTALAAAATLAAGLPAAANPALVDASLRNPDFKYVQGQLLVQFKPGAAAELREHALALSGAKTLKVLRGVMNSAERDGQLHLVQLPANKTVAMAIHELRQNGLVKFAEPNWIHHTFGAPNDPYYTNGSLWGYYGNTSPLKTNKFGSQAGEAWDLGKRCGNDVVIGIIDEGVMTTHPDTMANIWTNPFEIAGNGIDDDGNGFVDDIHGWDFKNDDASTFDGTTDDHGTHVSGTIGATADNGVGLIGICPTVKMIDGKFLEGSGSTADAIGAVDYMTDLKLRHGINLVATNNSWGGGGYSQALKDAIDRMGAADILFMAAAGNGNLFGVGQNNDNKANYPSNYDSANIIAVAAITSGGKKASFSNYGLTTVDLGAPGVGIWSTVPTANGPGYASYDGTSMATPHVTGAAALYKSLHPTATSQQIKSAILNKTAATASLDGKTVTGGRLNVSNY